MEEYRILPKIQCIHQIVYEHCDKIQRNVSNQLHSIVSLNLFLHGILIIVTGSYFETHG